MVSQNQKDFMLGALLGGTAGAAAALLLTPVSGPKLRQKVADKVAKVNGKRSAIKTAMTRPLVKKKKLPHRRAKKVSTKV